MLKHLYIKNFTLIDLLDIAFHSGFSVITGETGAGKSIILGAIGLLLGNRADSRQIKQGEKNVPSKLISTSPITGLNLSLRRMTLILNQKIRLSAAK